MAAEASTHPRTQRSSMFRACFSGAQSAPPRNQSLRKQLSRTYQKYISRKQHAEGDPSIPQANDYPLWNDDGLDPSDNSEDARDKRQAFTLSKGEDYLIHPSIQSIQMGLGWDKGVDVDASTAMFDSTLKAIDTVWYKKLCSTCGSVTHSGDNLTGAGEGDDEVITIKLSEIPFHVHHILFVVCVFSYDVSFRQIKSATVRMSRSKGRHENHELCRFLLNEVSGHAMVMGVLTRKGPYWSFRALGIPATGRNMMEVLRNPRNLDCLGTCPSWTPERRYITVQVLRGKGLAAKDESGFFRRRPSSDPYFVIRFQNKRYTSEYKSQTLEPEWKSAPFQMGWITEVESQLLKVQVFDYDVIGADDFMGVIQVPARSLFNLGPGNHSFWFELNRSSERAYKHEQVSGMILLSFKVDGSATHLQDI